MIEDNKVNQTPEEKNAQLEEQAEREFAEIGQGADPVKYAEERHKKIMAYAHTLMSHFEQIDINTVQGVFSYEAVPYIATFYRTVENLIDDSWSLSVDEIEFVGSTTVPDEALVGDWVMRVEELSDEERDAFFSEDDE